MIYVYLVVIVAVFSGGTVTGYKLQEGTVLELRAAVAVANAEALAKEQEGALGLLKADTEAMILKTKLEETNEANAKTVSAMARDTANRLRAHCGNKSGRARVPEAKDTGVSVEEAPDSAGLERFSELAYESSSYAQSAWEFISKNCGVK